MHHIDWGYFTRVRLFQPARILAFRVRELGIRLFSYLLKGPLRMDNANVLHVVGA